MMDGLNRNSRIWQVPEGDDPHEHALGPAPDDEEHHAAFPMASLQFMPGLLGAAGGQMLLSEWQLAGNRAGQARKKILLRTSLWWPAARISTSSSSCQLAGACLPACTALLLTAAGFNTQLSLSSTAAA